MKLWQWMAAFVAALLGRRKPGSGSEEQHAEGGSRDRIVPAGPPERGAENVVLLLLGCASAFSIGFVLVYGEFSPTGMPDELLGICLGMALMCIGAALAVISKRLVVTEEIEEDYPEPDPQAEDDIARMIHESGSRFTRKRLLVGAGAATGGALGLAAITPALSLGPIWDTKPLDETPWRRGIRVVDIGDKPMLASQIGERTFYTGFPEGASKELVGSSIVIVRVDPNQLQLPPGREGWAPYGIVAYSKICTHAGCAVALYRKPTFPAVEQHDALVCPCHYSTFDVFNGAQVIFGPAGRPLPQLPLMIDPSGYLRAAGNFSGRVGPGWWNVREPPVSQ